MEWILLLVVVIVAGFGLYVFRWGTRRLSSAPANPTGADTQPLETTSSVDSLARDLIAEFGGSPPAETLWDRCEQAGLEMSDVDAAIDRELRDRHVRTEVIAAPNRVIDLRGIDFVRMRVKGTHAYVKDSERNVAGGSEYLLAREPDNEHDPLAVAVFSMDRRKVGYISANRAAMIAPLLDAMPADAYRVAGAGATETTIRLWVDVPKVDALRKFVQSRE